MTDFSQPAPPVVPMFVTTYSIFSPGMMVARGSNANPGNPIVATWVANLAVYVPMLLPWPYPVRRVFWCNGSTVTGNRDFGIYTADGRQIYATAATTGSGASAPQYTDVTDFILPAGRYYFAYSNAGTTNQGWSSSAWVANNLRMGGILQQASAHPLPATMTGALTTNILLPHCGITRTPSGF